MLGGSGQLSRIAAFEGLSGSAVRPAGVAEGLMILQPGDDSSWVTIASSSVYTTASSAKGSSSIGFRTTGGNCSVQSDFCILDVALSGPHDVNSRAATMSIGMRDRWSDFGCVGLSLMPSPCITSAQTS